MLYRDVLKKCWIRGVVKTASDKLYTILGSDGVVATKHVDHVVMSTSVDGHQQVEPVTAGGPAASCGNRGAELVQKPLGTEPMLNHDSPDNALSVRPRASLSVEPDVRESVEPGVRVSVEPESSASVEPGNISVPASKSINHNNSDGQVISRVYPKRTIKSVDRLAYSKPGLQS